MAQKRDYYKVLGISREASEREIKAAYRKLAHEHHPDKNPEDKTAEDKFKEATEAYAVLSDSERRNQYDRFGHAGVRGVADDFSGSVQDIFSEIFGEFFGGGSGRGQRGAQRGSDLRYNLQVSFTDAAFGVEKEISLPRSEACNTCKGSGAKPGTRPEKCKTCDGYGQISVSRGFFTMAQTCPNCHGAGQVIVEKCVDCRGLGTKKVERKLTVKVPAGIDEGTQLRFVGEGEGGILGGGRGDLYVAIGIEPHPLFKREGYDVICDVPISFTQAALGAKIDVPTLDGMVNMQIEPSTQTGAIFRLRGKGIPHLRAEKGDRRGDQLVRVRIEVPKKLSKKQKDLLKEFAALSGEDEFPDSKGFFDKVKELFG